MSSPTHTQDDVPPQAIDRMADRQPSSPNPGRAHCSTCVLLANGQELRRKGIRTGLQGAELDAGAAEVVAGAVLAIQHHLV